MSLYNSKDKYGKVAKLFHWTIVCLVLFQYGSFFYKDWFLPEKDPFGSFLIKSIHKPFGSILFLVSCFAFFWHLTNTKVAFPASMASWEKLLAITVHRCLYVYLICAAGGGFFMTIFAGKNIQYWDLFETPVLMEKQESIANFLFEFHEKFAYIGIALICLHLAGLWKQLIVKKDPVFHRMLWW